MGPRRLNRLLRPWWRHRRLRMTPGTTSSGRERATASPRWGVEHIVCACPLREAGSRREAHGLHGGSVPPSRGAPAHCGHRQRPVLAHHQVRAAEACGPTVLPLPLLQHDWHLRVQQRVARVARATCLAHRRWTKTYLQPVQQQPPMHCERFRRCLATACCTTQHARKGTALVVHGAHRARKRQRSWPARTKTKR